MFREEYDAVVTTVRNLLEDYRSETGDDRSPHFDLLSISAGTSRQARIRSTSAIMHPTQGSTKQANLSINQARILLIDQQLFRLY